MGVRRKVIKRKKAKVREESREVKREVTPSSESVVVPGQYGMRMSLTRPKGGAEQMLCCIRSLDAPEQTVLRSGVVMIFSGADVRRLQRSLSKLFPASQPMSCDKERPKR